MCMGTSRETCYHFNDSQACFAMTHQTPDPIATQPLQQPTEPRRHRWLVWLFAVFIVGGAALLWRCGGAQLRELPTFDSPIEPGFQSPQMAAAQYSSAPVHANLGGMEVMIPAYFAEYVEYDGDPGWGEKRKGPVPPRTAQSRLRSFGFDVRYPDMVGKSSPDLRKEKREEMLNTTMWLDVTIVSGQHYPGDGFMDRAFKHGLNSPSTFPLSNFEKLDETQYGLEIYAPKGIDPKTGTPWRQHRDADDAFIYRNSANQVEAEIRCSNDEGLGERHRRIRRCNHHFNLEPLAKAWVTVHYRRGLLPEWRHIQDSVRTLIFSFKASAPGTAASAPAPATSTAPASSP